MLLLEFLYTSEMSFEMDYKREKNMLKNNLSFRRILIIYLLKDNRPFEWKLIIYMLKHSQSLGRLINICCMLKFVIWTKPNYLYVKVDHLDIG
jgi:hypothetical protein